MAGNPLERLSHLSLDDQYAVDRLCSRFEKALLADEGPSLEAYLGELPAPCRPALLTELLVLEVEHRRRQGERPEAGSYAGRFPSLGAVVREVFGPEAQGRDGPSSTARDEGPRAPLPKVEGYELLAELGRGGMGVVYKARHLALKRLVALKMILAGDFATEHHLARFLVEGEMLARLHHPNIVQVFEVGHKDGRPFLALEYVDGGTLSERQRRQPPGPLEAARLVEALARAVHFAHQNGVIHRDLKPANILLQGSETLPARVLGKGRGASDARAPVPKITDFGLARAAEWSRDLTESGLVVGTPSYMSPEQARGDRFLGPAADIYSLGAILYDLLAGRPPFRAETPLETVHLVLDREPPRPSKCQAGLPGDLETICLKCLEKDPARRYATADDLADDLRRWTLGEPIAARRVGPLERAWKWCRRRPALAASLAAVGVLLAAVALISTVAAVRLRQERNEALVQGERARQSERRRKVALVDSLWNAAPDGVPYMLEALATDDDLALPLLRQHFEDPASDADTKLRAAIGLTALGEPRTVFLLDAVPDARPAESGNLALALRAARDPGLADEVLARSREAKDPIARARYAILALDLGDLRASRPLLASSPDPNPRSVLIDQFQSWHGDLAALPALLRDNGDGDCLGGLCAAVGRVDPETLSEATKTALANVLGELYRNAPDAGTHAASGWALRQWHIPLPEIRPTPRPLPGRRWFVNPSGLTMVGIEPGGFVLQPSTAILLTRPYFLSDREVSVSLFRRFLEDRDHPPDETPGAWEGPSAAGLPEGDCPANVVAHRDMILFCNWLSRREGRRPCYRPSSKPDDWACDFGAEGYRLPTEAEWDYAQRAGSTSAFFFGDDPRWLASYAHVTSLRTAPGGSKLPSRWGLFDMVGNVWEHCWDLQGPLPQALLVDPAGPAAGNPWVTRGGAYDSGSYDTVSGFRFSAASRHSTFGFRVVCRDPLPAPDESRTLAEALARAVEQNPNSPLFHRARAEGHVRSARWKEAAAEMLRAIASAPGELSYAYHCGPLLLLAGDEAGYRRHCGRLLERFGTTKDPVVAERVAKSSLLIPRAAGDLPPLLALTDTALKAGEPHMFFKYFELARGMADYRAGRFPDALDWLTRSQARGENTLSPKAEALAAIFQAMAHHRLGQHDPARRAFEKGQRLLEDDLKALERGTVLPDWLDRLMGLIAYREARQLLQP